MRQSPENMSLKDWIKSKGVRHVADLLNVNPNTVRYWAWGMTYPKTEQMREIKRITKGVVGYEQIIDGNSCQPKRTK